MPDRQVRMIGADPAAGRDYTVVARIESSQSLRRGCGVRLAGGIYAAFMLSEPDEYARYELNPRVPADPAALGVSAVGVHLIERRGVWHLVDWIGATHYPTPEDFLSEVRRMGLSRRVQRTLDFSRLNEDSRVLCLHPRGRVTSVRADGSLEYGPAFIASYPIGALEVVRNTDDVPGTAATVTRAGRARLPVTLTEV